MTPKGFHRSDPEESWKRQPPSLQKKPQQSQHPPHAIEGMLRLLRLPLERGRCALPRLGRRRSRRPNCIEPWRNSVRQLCDISLPIGRIGGSGAIGGMPKSPLICFEPASRPAGQPSPNSPVISCVRTRNFLVAHSRGRICETQYGHSNLFVQ